MVFRPTCSHPDDYAIHHSQMPSILSHLALITPCSATLWAAGDMLSQRMQRMPMHRAGARQTALTATFGGLVFGPMGFAWYQWLDSVTNALFGCGGAKAIIAKVGGPEADIVHSDLW